MIRTVLLLGGGVQSSRLALGAVIGEITPMPECAVFADTGYEPRAVYEWLKWLEEQLSYPLYRVKRQKGSGLRDDVIRGAGVNGDRVASLPYFTIGKDGGKAIVPRQCTAEYKIDPITKFIRGEMLGLKYKQRAPNYHVIDQWLGISADEIQRCKVPFVDKWRRNVYPLVERGETRGHCLEWMKDHGYPEPPRSACLCCPFHSDDEWQKIKDGPQDEWEDVITFDREIRSMKGMDGDIYLHRSLRPIDEVVFQTAKNAGQMSLLDECDGMCGV